jgi:hypothetical protein
VDNGDVDRYEDDPPITADLAELSDDELERELTIAASSPRRSVRYEEFLAELERRRGGEQRSSRPCAPSAR